MYDKNDPRRLIELEILEVMREKQIEYLLDYAVESDADHIAEIAQLKARVKELADALMHANNHVTDETLHRNIFNLIAGARELTEEE